MKPPRKLEEWHHPSAGLMRSCLNGSGFASAALLYIFARSLSCANSVLPSRFLLRSWVRMLTRYKLFCSLMIGVRGSVAFGNWLSARDLADLFANTSLISI